MTEPLTIGFLLFPRLTQLDFTGPFEVMSRLPGAQVKLLWKQAGPVRAVRSTTRLRPPSRPGRTRSAHTPGDCWGTR